MYDPPGYLWALTIAGIIAIPAATCLVLYGGAARACLAGTGRPCWPGPRPSSSAAGSAPAQ